MKINFWPLALIIFTDRMPVEMGGRARGPVVLIRPKYRDDAGLLAHELVHVGQFWGPAVMFSILGALLLMQPDPLLVYIGYVLPGLGLAIHSVFYRFDRTYRLWAEVSAYRVQMQRPDRTGARMSAETAASMLMMPRYEFNLTAAEALAAITGGAA